MLTEFADCHGNRWRVEVDQVRPEEIKRIMPKEVKVQGPLPQRPGLRFVLFNKDGSPSWSTWLPCRTVDEAMEVSDDLAYLDRIVEELYYTAMAGV